MQANTLRQIIGQRLVAGFPGIEPDAGFVRLVREYKVGNVILFRHNIVDEAQLTRLCAQLRQLITEQTGIPPFITIDQEGGVVTRLPDTDANIPGAMALAATGDPANAYEMGRVTAAQLRRFGINFNLAPDMDINSNPDNPVIGVRSFGDDPGQVAAYGTAMLRGLLDGGVYACLKHFPGHGDTAVDSHLGLPRIDKSLDQLENRELIPFCAGIAAGVPAVMTTHILFPRLEPMSVPATMSRTILTGILRGKLDFDGLIISDCMEMQAIRSYYGTVNGVLAAMNAGVDLVFLSHTSSLAMQAVERIEQAISSGELDAREMEDSAARVLEHKRLCEAMQPLTAMPDRQQQRELVKRVRNQTITAVQLPEDGMPPLGENPLFVGCADYRATMVSDNNTDSVTFAHEMRRLAGKGSALVNHKDPTEAEISSIVSTAAKHSGVVLGTYNGHIFKGQLRLAEALASTGLPMVVVALRDPYDLAGLPSNVAAVCAWEYSRPIVEALWPVIDGKKEAVGKLPLNRLK